MVQIRYQSHGQTYVLRFPQIRAEGAREAMYEHLFDCQWPAFDWFDASEMGGLLEQALETITERTEP